MSSNSSGSTSTNSTSGSSSPSTSSSSSATSGTSTASSNIFDSDAAASDATKYYRRRLRIESVPRRIFVKEYRLSHEKMRYVANLVKDYLEPEVLTNNALSLEQRTALCVRLLASGSFQNIVGGSQGCSAQSVSKYFTAFLNGMTSHARDVIKFPLNDPNWLRETSEKFELIGRHRGMVGMIGAIDGTLIKIRAPHREKESYICRGTKDFAINVQMLFGPNKEVLDVCATHPGTSHDAHVFETSHLKERLDRKLAAGNFPYWIGGDKGYRNLAYLRTPVRQPINAQQRDFNKSFIPKRLVAEQGFGEIKGVFRMVDKTGGTLCYQPAKCAQIVVVCAMLHNIRILPEFGDDSSDSD